MGLLALGACTSANNVPQAKAPPVHSWDMNPKPVSELRNGGTYKLSITQWISQYNRYQTDGAQGDAVSIVAMMEPQLFDRGPDGAPKIHPDTLVSAAVTATSPKQVVTYVLNPKAKWSDGQPITWKDFAAQWKALNGSNPAYQVSSSAGYDKISTITQGATPNAVAVTFAQPFGDWQLLFDPLFPAAGIDTPEKFNTGWIEKVPVTAGPWKIGSLNKTTQTVTMVPDPTYWGTKPKLDSITYRALDSTADTDAYLNNEIDETPARAPEDYKRLKPAKNTDIRIGARWDETHLSFNSRGPLADVHVRQALGMGIDRSAIVRSVSKDLPFSLAPLGNHFFMPNQAGYQDNSGIYGKFDQAAAKKLLDAAGWTSSGAGKPRTKAGKPLSLTYLVNAGASQSNKDIAQLVQNMLGQIGVTVTLRQVPQNDYFDKYVNVGDFDLTVFRQVDEVFPSQLYDIFRQPVGNNVFQNYGRVGTPEIDQLMVKAQETPDRVAAAALYNQADAKIWEVGNSLELYQTPQILAFRHTLANEGAPGLATQDYVATGFTK
ncbi:ABC transporter family substrate-binding protein [Fodinicola feengrottensis]|uniref:ABC transporter family substrate-binding protein n=1 Tax=Fodinicola feengrottensis TaxID=435914 RepID=A0ABN2HXK1_9ACTN